jgi:hypothetical protein
MGIQQQQREADAGHQELQHAKSRSCWLQQRNVGQLAASDPVLLLSGSWHALQTAWLPKNTPKYPRNNPKNHPKNGRYGMQSVFHSKQRR